MQTDVFTSCCYLVFSFDIISLILEFDVIIRYNHSIYQSMVYAQCSAGCALDNVRGRQSLSTQATRDTSVLRLIFAFPTLSRAAPPTRTRIEG